MKHVNGVTIKTAHVYKDGHYWHLEPVYYFAAPDCDYDDDCGHRFLALHWWCTYRPRSLYVRFLLEASGAEDVEEFKTALISQDSYQTRDEAQSALDAHSI